MNVNLFAKLLNCETAELLNCEIAKLRNCRIAGLSEIKRMEGELALACSIVAMLREKEGCAKGLASVQRRK